MQHKLSPDFILSFCREKIAGHGEDSYCYSFSDTEGMLAVFDGCGGAGARPHPCYSGHTEAYVAARFCAGAFYDTFRRQLPSGASGEALAEGIFAPAAVERLKRFAPPRDPSAFQIKGSGVRTLPTTAAVALLRQEKDAVSVTAVWAGDSRVYLLDPEGLAQLTEDDTTVSDPMRNLYEDGVLTNVFCSDKPVKLHHRTVRMTRPFLVLAATDGCFGYLSTPMEFEGLLLGTLLESDSIAQWEERLADATTALAGDDHTLCLCACGYGSPQALQKSFAARYDQLRSNYLEAVRQMPLEDREQRCRLWESYRPGYMRYIKDGQAEWNN